VAFVPKAWAATLSLNLDQPAGVTSTRHTDGCPPIVLSQTGVVPSQLTTFPKITCCEVEGFPDALTANSDGSAGRQILRRLLGRYLQILNLAVTSVRIACSCSDAVRTPASWNRFYAAV
jgi:hypothetical protein